MVTPLPPEQARPIQYAAHLDGLDASTAALLAAAGALDDDACRAPSALPGWTRGHVLTHLARNADGLGNLVRWAATGVETPMYASKQARADDIEAGAGRPARELAADLADSWGRLRGQLAALPATALEVELRTGAGLRVTAWELPLLRWREVEIHRADLAVGYGPDDWPQDFCGLALDGLAPGALAGRDLPVQWLAAGGRVWRVGCEGPTVTGPRGQLLAWLVGRGVGPDLRLDPPGTVPESPAWV